MTDTSRPEHHAPRGLIVILGLLMIVGVVSLFISALQYQTSRSATRADVDRNAELSQKVLEGVYQTCLKANEIGEAAGLTVTPCTKPEPLIIEENRP